MKHGLLGVVIDNTLNAITLFDIIYHKHHHLTPLNCCSITAANSSLSHDKPVAICTEAWLLHIHGTLNYWHCPSIELMCHSSNNHCNKQLDLLDLQGSPAAHDCKSSALDRHLADFQAPSVHILLIEHSACRPVSIANMMSFADDVQCP